MKGKEKYLLLLFLAILIAGISIYTNPNWKEQIFIIAIVILTSVFVLIDLFSVRKRTTQDREAFGSTDLQIDHR